MFKVIFGIAIIAMLATFGMRFYHLSNGSPMFEITVPTYGNSTPDTYYATSVREENGCVIFKDTWGFEHKVCGAYQIQKW